MKTVKIFSIILILKLMNSKMIQIQIIKIKFQILSFPQLLKKNKI